MKATARIKRIISHSAIALALGCAVVQPACAQLTTIDPAHIGMQLGQWVQNAASWVKEFEQWKEQFTQWKNQMTSKMGAALNVNLTSSTDAKTRRKEMAAAIQKMRDNSGCDKITDTNSQGLCNQESELKVQRAQRLLKVLDDSEANIKKLNQLVAEYKELAESGTEDDSKEGKMKSKEVEIHTVQEDINSKFAEAETDFQVYDRQIEMIHSVRVDYANTQVEGKTPGTFDKLISTAAVAGTLEVAKKKYKTQSESLRNDTSNY